MYRIVILGDGQIPYKTCAYLRSLDIQADIIWMTLYSEEKYPWTIASELLRMGISPGNWSRTRAKWLVDFKNYSRTLGVQKEKAKKIKVEEENREITVLTNAGETTYQYDAILAFPPLVPGLTFSRMLSFPSSACLQSIVHSVGQPEETLVIGDDLVLVANCLHLGKRLTWLRPEYGRWEPEILREVDEFIQKKGINLVDCKQEELWPMADSLSEGKRLNIASSGLVADTDWMEGLQLDLSSEKQNGIFALLPYTEILPGQYNIQTWISAARELADHALQENEGRIKKIIPGMESVQFLDRQVSRHGNTESELHEQGKDVELALCAGEECFECGSEYFIKMLADRSGERISGIQALGSRAGEWVSCAEEWFLNEKRIFDNFFQLQMFWHGPGKHPVHKSLSIIYNKKRVSGILNITPRELIESENKGAEFFLLDVREKSENSAGKLAGAYNIPLNELANRYNEIPRFVPLVLYSHISGRAFTAAKYLRAKGAKQLYVLDGGYKLWPYKSYNKID